MKENLIQKLKDLEIVKRGDFLLSSRKRADIYFDIKEAYGYPDSRDAICNAMHEIFDKHVTCVAGYDYGGITLASILADRYKLKLSLIRRKEKEHGLRKQIECYVPNVYDLVAIADDVTTTGESLKEVVDALRKTQTRIAGCYVVLKREELKDEDIERLLGVPFYFLLTSKDLL